MSEFVQVTIHDHWAEVKLNRPDVHNAFHPQLISEIIDAFIDVVKVQTVRLVVLSGAGKSFCAGADLNWMKSMKSYSEVENYNDSKKLRELFEVINSSPLPVLGWVQGPAYGGGVGLVSVCDYVIASEVASFALTEVKLGLIPAVISPYVQSKIGASWARALFTSGRKVEADEALKIGLVHEVVADKDFDTRKNDVLKMMLANGPVAIQEAKKLCHEIEKGRADLGDYTCRTIAKVRVSHEGQEGLSAALEKRRPSWSVK